MRRIDEFLLSAGARIRVDDARRPHGRVTAFNNPAYDILDRRAQRHPAQRRLWADCAIAGRQLASRSQFQIVNRTYPEGRTA